VNAVIPATLAAGTWYLGAVADALSLFTESNEGNNALAGNTLLVSGSDLAVVSVSGPASGPHRPDDPGDGDGPEPRTGSRSIVQPFRVPLQRRRHYHP